MYIAIYMESILLPVTVDDDDSVAGLSLKYFELFADCFR